MGSLIALGDSIVNGFTRPLAGIPALGCGQWLAAAADLSYTRYAQGGWTTAQILADKVPRLKADYDIAVVSIGTNDAAKKLPLDEFERDARKVLSAVTEHASQVAVLSIPLSDTYSERLARVADELKATMVPARLSGPRVLRADRVHPTAVGNLELADRVAAALAVGVRPSDGWATARISPTYYVGYGFASIKPAAKRTAKRMLGR
jgi:lysophospholipase L1-like esterase